MPFWLLTAVAALAILLVCLFVPSAVLYTRHDRLIEIPGSLRCCYCCHGGGPCTARRVERHGTVHAAPCRVCNKKIDWNEMQQNAHFQMTKKMFLERKERLQRVSSSITPTSVAKERLANTFLVM